MHRVSRLFRIARFVVRIWWWRRAVPNVGALLDSGADWHSVSLVLKRHLTTMPRPDF